jgi:hypothetical protein
MTVTAFRKKNPTKVEQEKRMNRTAWKCTTLALLAAAMVIPAACSGQGQSVSVAGGTYKFTVVDYPGASLTQAYGINPRGDIVGTYQLPAGRDATVLSKGVQNATGKEYHGFVLKDGKYTTIDYPNLPGKKTDYTIATSIDDKGLVYGYYASEGEPLTAAYGFIMDKAGKWSTIPNKVDASLGEPTMRPAPFRVGPDGTQYG